MTLPVCARCGNPVPGAIHGAPVWCPDCVLLEADRRKARSQRRPIHCARCDKPRVHRVPADWPVRSAWCTCTEAELDRHAVEVLRALPPIDPELAQIVAETLSRAGAPSITIEQTYELIRKAGRS